MKLLARFFYMKKMPSTDESAFMMIDRMTSRILADRIIGTGIKGSK